VRYRRAYLNTGSGYFRIIEPKGAQPPQVGDVAVLTLERGPAAPRLGITVTAISPVSLGPQVESPLYQFAEGCRK
jgi:hypothetical protein